MLDNKGKKFYLRNEDLLTEIIESKKIGKLTPAAEKMLILLANRTIKKLRYYNDPTIKEDCLQEGLLALFSKWNKFDETKFDNPFAFYTQIFKLSIAAGWNRITKKKGDPKNKIKIISIYGSPDNDNGTVNWL